MTQTCSLGDRFRAARSLATDDKRDPTSRTCDGWTSVTAQGKPRIDHSWSAQSGKAGGCARGVKVESRGGPQPGDFTVGAGGGYGGISCFASMR